jgi:membrane protein implicated in regulation of membrane protease activity
VSLSLPISLPIAVVAFSACVLVAVMLSRQWRREREARLAAVLASQRVGSGLRAASLLQKAEVAKWAK